MFIQIQLKILNLNKQESINLSSFSAGIYLLLVENEHGVLQDKIVVY